MEKKTKRKYNNSFHKFCSTQNQQSCGVCGMGPQKGWVQAAVCSPHTLFSKNNRSKAVTLPAATAGATYMQLQKNYRCNCTKSSTILTHNEEKL